MTPSTRRRHHRLRRPVDFTAQSLKRHARTEGTDRSPSGEEPDGHYRRRDQRCVQTELDSQRPIAPAGPGGTSGRESEFTLQRALRSCLPATGAFRGGPPLLTTRQARSIVPQLRFPRRRPRQPVFRTKQGSVRLNRCPGFVAGMTCPLKSAASEPAASRTKGATFVLGGAPPYESDLAEHPPRTQLDELERQPRVTPPLGSGGHPLGAIAWRRL